MVTLAGQSLLRHIENQDIDAVSGVVQNGMINLDERDEVSGREFVKYSIISITGSMCLLINILQRACFLNLCQLPSSCVVIYS